MSHATLRNCPRCEQQLVAQDVRGEGGLTRIWRCVCGWASARTIAIAEDEPRARTASGISPRVDVELPDEPQKVRK